MYLYSLLYRKRKVTIRQPNSNSFLTVQIFIVEFLSIFTKNIWDENLKVHKNDNFLGSDFELVSYAQILKFCKNIFLIGPLLGEIQLFHLV